MAPLWLVTIGSDPDRYIILRAETGAAAVEGGARVLPCRDAIAPSQTVKAEETTRGQWTVGKRYRGPQFDATDKGIYDCIAYDWRTGFWMKNIETGEMRDVSERAIGRTFHEVREVQGGV